MKFSKAQVIRIAIVVALFALTIYANFYAIRSMMRYGVEMYLYDKLLVAYQEGGGMPGLKDELGKVLAKSDMPRELAAAREFEKNLDKIKAPEEFLESAVKEKRQKINLFRNLRNAAFVLMLFIFLLRFALIRGKDNKR